MKKPLSWKVILIIAAIAYLLKAVIGGIIGDMFGLIGLICLALGIVNLIVFLIKRNKK